MKNLFKTAPVLATASLTRGIASLRNPGLFSPPFSNFEKSEYQSMLIVGSMTCGSKDVVVFGFDVGHPELPQTVDDSKSKTFMEKCLHSVMSAISACMIDFVAK